MPTRLLTMVSLLRLAIRQSALRCSWCYWVYLQSGSTTVAVTVTYSTGAVATGYRPI